MRITVLNQFAKGLVKSDPQAGESITDLIKRIKWRLWHGNVERALVYIEECLDTFDVEDLAYEKRKKFRKHVDEFWTYINNNCHLIPNYGEKYRYGETITTSFVESTINEVVAKRMAKKQQMQWTHEGAHHMLQMRTAVLNSELPSYFEKWFPDLNIAENDSDKEAQTVKMAA